MSVNPLQPLAGYLFGLTLANDATSPNATIDVAPGAAADSTNSLLIALPQAFSKLLQSSGSWAPGAGSNGLDTGARAASATYHVFAIAALGSGAGDILFSLSATSPALPIGYPLARRIGSVRTDGSGNIVPFLQRDDVFYLQTPNQDISSESLPANTRLSVTLGSIPTGVNVRPIMTPFGSASGTDVTQLRIYDPDLEDNGDIHSIFSLVSGTTSLELGTPVNDIYTNTSAQVRAWSVEALQLSINVFGWIDGRGRLS